MFLVNLFRKSTPVTGKFPSPSMTATLVMIVGPVWENFGPEDAEVRLANAKRTTTNDTVIVFIVDIRKLPSKDIFMFDFRV